jgi:hypothetical protein
VREHNHVAQRQQRQCRSFRRENLGRHSVVPSNRAFSGHMRPSRWKARGIQRRPA